MSFHVYSLCVFAWLFTSPSLGGHFNFQRNKKFFPAETRNSVRGLDSRTEPVPVGLRLTLHALSDCTVASLSATTADCVSDSSRHPPLRRPSHWPLGRAQSWRLGDCQPLSFVCTRLGRWVRKFLKHCQTVPFPWSPRERGRLFTAGNPPNSVVART